MRGQGVTYKQFEQPLKRLFKITAFARMGGRGLDDAAARGCEPAKTFRYGECGYGSAARLTCSYAPQRFQVFNHLLIGCLRLHQTKLLRTEMVGQPDILLLLREENQSHVEELFPLHLRYQPDDGIVV